MEKGEASRVWCRKYLMHFADLNEEGPGLAYELQLDSPPQDTWRCPKNWTDLIVNESDLSKDTISLVLGIINHSRGAMGKLERQWTLSAMRVNRISTIFAWLIGFLYATARLILLAVAFAAFRKQNEDLYIDTWTRFMPSWR